jgi:hypothetical protein
MEDSQYLLDYSGLHREAAAADTKEEASRRSLGAGIKDPEMGRQDRAKDLSTKAREVLLTNQPRVVVGPDQ